MRAGCGARKRGATFGWGNDGQRGCLPGAAEVSCWPEFVDAGMLESQAVVRYFPNQKQLVTPTKASYLETKLNATLSAEETQTNVAARRVRRSVLGSSLEAPRLVPVRFAERWLTAFDRW